MAHVGVDGLVFVMALIAIRKEFVMHAMIRVGVRTCFCVFLLSLRPHTQLNQGRSVGLHAEYRFCANRHVTWQPVDETSLV